MSELWCGRYVPCLGQTKDVFYEVNICKQVVNSILAVMSLETECLI